MRMIAKPRTAPGITGAAARIASCDEAWRSRLGLWRGQQLHPVQTALGSLTRRVSDSHLGEPGVHDIFAVTGTVEPALYDFLGRFRAVRNVFTDEFFAISAGTHPLGR